MFPIDLKMPEPIWMKLSGNLQVSPADDAVKFDCDRHSVFKG